MAEQAQVKSVDALDSLRAAFLSYQTKSKRSLDTALEESSRLRQWLQGDCRIHWEGQVRQWGRRLDQAKAELMTARLSALVDRSVRQEEAVNKASQGLAHAQEKLKCVKRWSRDFENTTGPQVRRLENVREQFCHQIPKATAWLYQASLTLEAYAESHGPSPAPPTASGPIQLETGSFSPETSQDPPTP